MDQPEGADFTQANRSATVDEIVTETSEFVGARLICSIAEAASVSVSPRSVVRLMAPAI